MVDVKPGIYLEIIKGSIGTGGTAKSAEYRNFWMTLDQTPNQVEMLLLDQDFLATGLKQKIPISEFETNRFAYVPQGDKRYQLLLKKLGQPKTKAPAKTEPVSDAQPAASKPEAKTAGKASGKWWEGEQRELTAEDIFQTRDSADKAGPKKKKAPSAVNLKKNWWDTK